MPILMILYSLAVLVPPASAELYRYRDDAGTLHVVDSPEAIPEAFRPRSAAVAHVVASSADEILSGPCAGKKLCGIIYVAPWCPYCKQDAPKYKQWLARNSAARRQGLMVVVGGGRRSGDNFALAADYGSYSLADDDQEQRKLLGVSGYPSYFVIDRNGPVLKGSEATAWIHYFFDDAASEGLKKSLREGRGVPAKYLAD